MMKLLNSVLTAALLTGVSLAQNPSQPNGGLEPNTKVQFAPDTIIRVELTKSVDAKKAKVGDEVSAKTMDDFLSGKNEVLAPRGSRVVAHVAEVSPHQGESASTLGIAFDKMVLKSGTEVPLKAVIQAIGRPESSTGAVNESVGDSGGPGVMSRTPSPARGGYGGAAPSPGATAPVGAGTTGAADASSATAIGGQLTPNAQGVVGMSGVSLGTGTAQDSLLSSQKHNVKLESGTQMILRVIP
jgi:hypothetical protein